MHPCSVDLCACMFKCGFLDARYINVRMIKSMLSPIARPKLDPGMCPSARAAAPGEVMSNHASRSLASATEQISRIHLRMRRSLSEPVWLSLSLMGWRQYPPQHDLSPARTRDKTHSTRSTGMTDGRGPRRPHSTLLRAVCCGRPCRCDDPPGTPEPARWAFRELKGATAAILTGRGISRLNDCVCSGFECGLGTGCADGAAKNADDCQKAIESRFALLPGFPNRGDSWRDMEFIPLADGSVGIS